MLNGIAALAQTSSGISAAVTAPETKAPAAASTTVTPEKPTPAPSSTTVATAAKTWPSDSPIGVAQSYEAEIRSLIHKYDAKKTSKELEERDQALGRKVRKFFDFEELAKLSLGNHWATLKAPQRQKFTDIFIRLIERSYLHKTREMIADYAVVYDNQEIMGGHAKVSSTIKKDDLDVKVVYEMRVNPQAKTASGHPWIIYNVIFDNLDLLGNYRSQFNRIISQKSFAELIRIMEQRLKNPAETV